MIGDFRLTDILGLVVVLLALGYIVANRRFLPGGFKNIFLLAFLFFTAEIVFANLETVGFPALMNLLEHAMRAGFAVLLAVACWTLGVGAGEERL